MAMLTQLGRWLDVRPGEGRLFGMSTVGAFLVISFVVASRAVRDAFFLDEFSVEAFPYITIAVALIALPTIGVFSRFLARRDPSTVYRTLLLVLIAGLVALQYFTELRPPEDQFGVQVATVAFYLWTAIGTLLLTSGFWIVTADHYALRDAKRLFGMVSGGGTLGAMLTGLALEPLAGRFGNSALVVLLTGTLVLLWIQQWMLPPSPESSTDGLDGEASLRDSLGLVVSTPHLRTIAAIVAVATLASFMVDYQFKGAAAARFAQDEDLAGFFGKFYGITGVLALLLQVLAASRLLSAAGVAVTLSVLPAVLVFGSTFFLFVPTLAVATSVRGADNALRRSLHRTVIEYLYVPIPSSVRRRTKTFIDSSVDSAAEGLSALIVAVLIAVGLDARGMSLLIIAFAVTLIVLARSMGRRYFETLRERLQDAGEGFEEDGSLTQFVAGEATVTMTTFDIDDLLSRSGLPVVDSPGTGRDAPGPDRVPEMFPSAPGEGLEHPDPAVVAAALSARSRWDGEDVPALTRLLARDALSRQAVQALVSVGAAAAGPLGEILRDEEADFVVRRRTPRALAGIDTVEADEALLDGLFARRFEVRYRSGVALARRRKQGYAQASGFAGTVWRAIRGELGRERPIWELQRLLDDRPTADDLVTDRVYGRGELSLEHTFRLLSLVLDSDAIRTAFHGVLLGDHALKSLSLEYLEQTLPADVRDRLWPFIGDISDFQRRQQIRPMDEVVADLLKTGATLFGGELERERVREALRDSADPEKA